jgi:hypothetical protein
LALPLDSPLSWEDAEAAASFSMAGARADDLAAGLRPPLLANGRCSRPRAGVGAIL